MYLGVAPNFACGQPIYVPDAFEPAKHVGDPTLISDGNWTFVDRGSDGTKAGYYLAIYRAPNLFGKGQWGCLEAYDTWIAHGLNIGPIGAHNLNFKEFAKAVKLANPPIHFSLGIGKYVTQSGQDILFTIAPHSAIIWTTAEPDRSVYTDTFAHGSIVNSEQISVAIGKIGSGLIKISNSVIGTIILDMHLQTAPGDPKFGMHHPTRIPESGPVERAGTNREVWVDSNYPGTGLTAGDFGDPCRTLVDAMNAVGVGGTINIINMRPENTPGVYTKRMTIKAVPGPTTLVQ